MVVGSGLSAIGLPLAEADIAFMANRGMGADRPLSKLEIRKRTSNVSTLASIVIMIDNKKQAPEFLECLF